MGRSPMLPALLSLLGVGLAPQLATAQNLISNGSFPVDISGWEVSEYPETTFSWDSFGNPQGSLRIETGWEDAPHGTGFIALGPCLTLSEGPYLLRGDVYPDLHDAACRVLFRRYFQPSCQGSPAHNANGATMSGIWHTLESTIENPFPTQDSFRVVLVMQVNPAPGVRSCNFDNVSLVEQGGSVVEVPALGPTGFTLLALALAAAALIALRRI